MTSHQVRYEGPAALAVRVATLLADAQGIELRSADRQEHADGAVETVLVLTVEGTPEAVMAAVGSVDDELPAEARITMDGPTEAP
ncbi:MAG TPA: hypothetical protein VHF27_04215 [Acidimicrobiales bacterium]|nr:hypothetical protein [Acidimicrobiales bacterium]